MRKWLFGFPVFLSFLTLATLLLNACSNEKSFTTEEGNVTVKEEGKKVEFKGKDENLTVTGNESRGQIKIKTKEGESTLSYNKERLPDEFPNDVPVYTPSTVKMTQILDNGKNATASLNTDDDTAKVAAFYKKGLPQAGWEIKGEMNMGNTFLLQGEKGDKALNVTVNKEQEKTLISLVVGEK